MKWPFGSPGSEYQGVPERRRDLDILSHNRSAWDHKVETQNPWTIPVSSEEIDRARQGQFKLYLTPTIPVPMDWFPKLQGAQTLCLASGGGQQGPLLAAAGAEVTVFDSSPKQLDQDRLVAQRDSLSLQTVEGDMSDLSAFSDQSFDLIVHPCSNCFVPAIRPVWQECHRVLRQDGTLMAGFTNPVRYLFDPDRLEENCLEVRYPIPYSDLEHLSEEDRQRIIVQQMNPLEFGHSLTDQIGGQISAGFLLAGFFEDCHRDSVNDPISRYTNSFIATLAHKR